MSRNLLHKTKLDAFKLWCALHDIPTREGKGNFQVLQVLTPDSGWQVIFSKLDMPEHYSTNLKLDSMIKQFIKDSK